MLCDELSKLPIFETCVSGHVSDKTSFRNVITDNWDSIKAQFKDLRYLTGDSALCTSPIAKAAKEHGIKMVTRIPDKNDEATACRKMLKAHPEELVPVEDVYKRQAGDLLLMMSIVSLWQKTKPRFRPSSPQYLIVELL